MKRITVNISNEAYSTLNEYKAINDLETVDDALDQIILTHTEHILPKKRIYKDIYYEIVKEDNIWTVKYYKLNSSENLEQLPTVHRHINRPPEEEIKEDIDRSFYSKESS
ncbi:hypothetical protein [Methanosalsum natronophilum]|uniref:hypothetical protein n=1 Tax=Methanosalsum natronophilum TaxID=768733 RepID=UPI0021677E38|nr:hypothetical protein [Methanosalsum natronophilum]MCS3923339.1 uncharacterized protein with PIN domain [Methanosalsum natronophilum]